MQIGVFGSSLNPPTLGHMNVLEQAVDHFDEVVIVPARSHAFQKKLIAIEHRMNMLQLILQTLDLNVQRRIKILDVERELYQRDDQPIYTYHVLEYLTQYFNQEKVDCELSFIIGPDLAERAVWQKFYRFKEIEEKWSIFVVKQNSDIRSERVRHILQARSTTDFDKNQQLIPLVGKAIADYIIKHQLYLGQL